MLACKGKNLYLTSGVNSNILKIQGYCLAEEILTENRRCDEFALLRVYNRKMNYIEKYPAKFGEILKMYKYWLNL